ncbi:hypothetical protein PC116_g11354 [Phytophthora cactorum]|nr:hypothetical protein PC116_g11354 [Phytophthora cactorum]
MLTQSSIRGIQGFMEAVQVVGRDPRRCLVQLYRCCAVFKVDKQRCIQDSSVDVVA